MTEPIYNYVKGRGWVVSMVESYTALAPCGRLVTLERAKPAEGERGWWINDDWSLEKAFEDILEYDSNPYGWVVEGENSVREVNDSDPRRVIRVITA